jgi:hypothetical protein
MKRIASFYWIFEWSQLFQKCNWYTTTLADIYFELDVICGHWEINFCLLGMGFNLRIVYNEDSELRKILEQSEQELKAAMVKGSNNHD